MLGRERSERCRESRVSVGGISPGLFVRFCVCIRGGNILKSSSQCGLRVKGLWHSEGLDPRDHGEARVARIARLIEKDSAKVRGRKSEGEQARQNRLRKDREMLERNMLTTV